jgi:hypothetical protein
MGQVGTYHGVGRHIVQPDLLLFSKIFRDSIDYVKYLAANDILKLIYNPYRTKDKHSKLHWKMKLNKEI